MSAGGVVDEPAAVAGPTRAALVVATFLAALLLFFVEPLAAKYLLPWFGGGPGVWTTCMLFFQVVLLGGYAYAHGSVRRLSPRAQGMVHFVMLGVAAGALAVVLAALPRWRPASIVAGGSELTPLRQILVLLAVSLGLPCLVLSATSPLLNAWYARGVAGGGVYRLYALSNAGSLLALLAYPFVVEPLLSRRAQVKGWAVGFAVFVCLCTYCALRAAKSRPSAASTGEDTGPPRQTGAFTRLLWVALPACASVLLLATTNTLMHDVAAVPLLWVLPLALYLLTFVLAFDARRWYRRWLAGFPLAAAAFGACWVLLGADVGGSAVSRIGVLGGAMFVCCMVCHGELAALKPPPSGMTGYYLTIAAGGALGSLLVAVVAPLVLDRYVELHLGLWVCCLLALLTPYAARRGSGALADAPRPPHALVAMFSVTGLVCLGAVLWAARDPHAYGAGTPIARARDFHGVLTVYESRPDDPRVACRIIRHAGVTHGLQFLAPEKRRLPTTYYGTQSGIAAGVRSARAGRGGAGVRVGVVGLGSGTTAALGEAGDTFRFYELSPTVERIARQYFTYLADSPARCDVTLGDARLSLERQEPQGFDVLVLDAFSGHAIPVHLLTREAFALYRRHLARGGVIAVHVSNRYVDLEPAVAAQAREGGWQAVKINSPDGNEFDGFLEADWVLVTDDAGRLDDLREAGARPARVDPELGLWTDEYASLYRVLR